MAEKETEGEREERETTTTTNKNSNSSSSNNNQQQPGQTVRSRNIVVAGGGIIGTSVAYYLARDHRGFCWGEKTATATAATTTTTTTTAATLTIVDPTGRVASCASGKAGGFLARDWRDGTQLQELQRKGFDLHQELAAALERTGGTSTSSTATAASSTGQATPPPPTATTTATTNEMDAGAPKLQEQEHPTGYRRLTCAAVAVDESDCEGNDNDNDRATRVPNKPPSKKLIDLEWVDPDVVLWGSSNSNNNDGGGDDDATDGFDSATGGGAVVPMGDEETIAQVHPRKLCEALWAETLAIASASGSRRGGNENDDEPKEQEEEPSSSSSSPSPSPASVELLRGRIVRALTDNAKSSAGAGVDTRSITGVELEDGRVLPADVLVVACGPWTHEANRWFATGDETGDETEANDVLPPVTAIKCHSILVPSSLSSSGRSSNTQAVFFDSNGAIGEDGDLEVYPRPDGDSYVNGFAGEECVCLEKPGEEVVEEDKIGLLRSAMEFVERNDSDNGGGGGDSRSSTDSGSGGSGGGDTELGSPSSEAFRRQPHRDHTQQVCYWPETPDGLPIIGKIPDIRGAYVAAGHSVWGILQGPATGKALAELIATGKSDFVDLAPFGLERYYE